MAQAHQMNDIPTRYNNLQSYPQFTVEKLENDATLLWEIPVKVTKRRITSRCQKLLGLIILSFRAIASTIFPQREHHTVNSSSNFQMNFIREGLEEGVKRATKFRENKEHPHNQILQEAQQLCSLPKNRPGCQSSNFVQINHLST